MGILQSMSVSPTVPFLSTEVLPRSSVRQSAPQRCKILFKEIKRFTTIFFVVVVASLNNGELELLPAEDLIARGKGEDALQSLDDYNESWGLHIWGPKYSSIQSLHKCPGPWMGGWECLCVLPVLLQKGSGLPGLLHHICQSVQVSLIPSDWSQLNQA